MLSTGLHFASESTVPCPAARALQIMKYVSLSAAVLESIGFFKGQCAFTVLVQAGERIWNSADTLAGFCVSDGMDSTGSRMIRAAGEGLGSVYRMLGGGWTT